jgi:hypothetical protein
LELEYELLDTGVFDDDRYFRRLCGVRQALARRDADSNSPSGIVGPESASLHILPTLWFSNTRSWSIKSLAVLKAEEVLDRGFEAAAMKIIRSY